MKWVLLVIFIIYGGLISSWVVRVIICIENRIPLMKKVFHLYIMSKIVESFVRIEFILITWRILFHERAERETNLEFPPYITKILIELLASVFVWLLKSRVIRVSASYFYVTTYFERIRESLFNQFVIKTLSGPASEEI
jgi:hypothetical protein